MRINTETLRRVDRLERSKSVARTVAMWPPILSIDEWEAQALPMQDALRRATRGNEETRHTSHH